MINAPAPITGGINCPPVEAAASTAAANFAGKPALRINGIVMTPVETVFATEEPDTEPINPEPNTATNPGPPTKRPAAQRASSIIKSPAPDLTKKAPNRMNIKTNVQEIRAIAPNIPSPEKNERNITVSRLSPAKPNIPSM